MKKIIQSRGFRVVFYSLSSLLVLWLLATMFHSGVRLTTKLVYYQTLGRISPKNIHPTEAKTRLTQTSPRKINFPLKNSRIVVYKSKRILQIFDGDELLKEYSIALGGNPVGFKTRKGDQKTPEGEYYICTRNDKSNYHLFMGLNYPNEVDAKRALESGFIDKKLAEKIIQAKKERKGPDWYTKMGGAVGLHGWGTGYDWTLGCIALENKDIEEIWQATSYWTFVTIYP